MKYILLIVFIVLSLNFKSAYSNNNIDNEIEEFNFNDFSNDLEYNKLIQENIIENGLPSLTDYSQFLLGFIEGIGINITNEESLCFKNENGSVADLKDGVLALQKGLSTIDIPKMSSGIVKIGGVILQIPTNLKECGISDKIVQITYIAASFISGPSGIVTFILRDAFNIFVNSGGVLHNLTEIFVGLQNADFFKLGKNLGQIVDILMIKHT
ncbi:hypothetical protein DICPUDRAFT_97781 [Dictyostelium purpureum]|uniref:Uncharacterized protein n=1 Tax=Dictyostelium purpureum TaxID=5786 RepID=F0ZJR5_DICPU|nr:uncharacterized protein DICPUDRAFT_97781 [Dictyostelium purpureum]EGC35828.1 hypothetical protein DICPUDRAFT_97781 [Dictyostelium purpureum]|eukprot:XP_003287665.1 hypothetical protein DICPUDRAFT_97781 [Dictyostelium purpureum]